MFNLLGTINELLLFLVDEIMRLLIILK